MSEDSRWIALRTLGFLALIPAGLLLDTGWMATGGMMMFAAIGLVLWSVFDKEDQA